MKLFITCLVLTLTTIAAKAQNDTTIHYYWGNWKECAKDSAVYISKVYPVGDQWERKDYWTKGLKLQSEERWLDSKCTRPVGTSTWYNEDGVTVKKQSYENEKTVSTFHYFNNGNKKAIVLYNSDGQIVKQTGWEENGVEISNYIYEQEAHFPGGPEAWRDFLVSRINKNTAARAKAPVGMYTVKVQFIINKEGRVERAQAISVLAACQKCGEEAVKIINSSPRWEHATQYGHPVIYQAIQFISWQVED
jgi:hypothetical protein